MRDYSMLDLFRQEVETQVKSLKQSLSILKEQPSQAGELDTAIRSLHAIVGSAQLVEIAAAATLAEEMRVRLTALQNGATTLTDALLDRLLHAGDLLIEISDATSDQTLEGWLSQHSDDLAQTQAAIVESNVAPISEKRVNSSETSDLKPSDDPKPHLSSLLLDSSMMELFRLEVEAQATLLNNGLLALETQSHSAQELEALMRAAHSVKGAARIVGLEAAVQLAHVMEDCFVAAQDHTITLDSDRADVLLRGVDLLQSLSQVSDGDLPNWLTNHTSEFETVRSTIEAIRNAEGTAAIQALKANFAPEPIGAESTPVAHESEDLPSPASEETSSADAATAHDRVVRVSADNLNRMMGLAGESLIEANWLPPFADSLMVLKSRQLELSKNLEQLQQTVMLQLRTRSRCQSLDGCDSQL